MGIQNLLQAVKPIIETDVQVSVLRGKRVAVDGYSWLHKATYGCCVELCLNQPTIAWIQYCIQNLDLLLENGLEVTMVFDGANLPAKAATESERQQKREERLAKGMAAHNAKDATTARQYFAQAVDVTPKMAAELISVIRERRPKVQVIVAPFEADAELSFLCANGLVDAVVSEDSDNIPYGSPEIIFKLDRTTGTCHRLRLANLFQQPIDRFDCRGFSQDMVILMCILSGCDYLDSPCKGLGIKKAHKLVSEHKTVGNLLRALRLSGLSPLVPYHQSGIYPQRPELASLLEYELRFHQAHATFRHQVVFDPRVRKTVHCTPIEYSKLPLCLQLLCVSADQRELSFLGSLLDDGVACGIADGVLCPDTKQPFLISPSASLLSTPRIPLSISRASSQSSIASLSSSRSLSQSLPPRPATSKPKAFSQAFASLAHQPTPSASSHPFSPYTTGKIVISPYFKTAVDSQRSQSDSKLAAGMAKISTISDLAKLSCESSDAQEEGVYDLYHLDALCYDAQVQSNPRHKPSSTPSPLTVESAMEREVSNPSPSPSPPPPPPKASPTLSLETFSYVEKDSGESVRSSSSRPASSLSRSLSPTGVGGVGHGDWREGGSAVKKQKKVVANMTTKDSLLKLRGWQLQRIAKEEALSSQSTLSSLSQFSQTSLSLSSTITATTTTFSSSSQCSEVYAVDLTEDSQPLSRLPTESQDLIDLTGSPGSCSQATLLDVTTTITTTTTTAAALVDVPPSLPSPPPSSPSPAEERPQNAAMQENPFWQYSYSPSV